MPRDLVLNARVDTTSVASIAHFMQNIRQHPSKSSLIGDSIDVLASILIKQGKAKVFTQEEAYGYLNEIGLGNLKTKLEDLAEDIATGPEVTPDLQRIMEEYNKTDEE